jgi:DNA-binding CsgD family transcriptional regulator
MDNSMDDSDIPNSPEKRKEPPSLLNIDHLATQTINLDQFLTKDVTPSGSFDLRGEIWKSTFGKLLQALPIPACLVDESFRITMMNHASARIGPDYDKAVSQSFEVLFPDPKTTNTMLTVAREVFGTRKPQIAEAILKIGKNKIAARLTFRSIRIYHERFLLVMVEDLSAEKRQLSLSKKHERELKAAYGQVEDLVTYRTAELRKSNNALKVLLVTIESKAKDDKRKLLKDLRISLEPLLALMKAEPASPNMKLLLNSVDLAVHGSFESESSDWIEFATKLTPREIQICQLIRSGLTSKQIAEVLGVTADGVQSHRYQIRKKIGLDRSEGSLAAWLHSYHSKKNWHAS